MQIRYNKLQELLSAKKLDAILVNWRSCCNISLLMLSDKSALSTNPLTKRK